MAPWPGARPPGEDPAAADPPPAPEAAGLGAYLDPSAPSSTKTNAGEGDTGYVSAKPLLMIGAAGPDVAELGHLLAEHGYENRISHGTADAPPVLDDELMALVILFQQANGIDPWGPEGDGATNPALLRRDHSGVVDARTWEALLGAPVIITREGARAA